MKYEERISKVLNKELDFLTELVANIILFIQNDRNCVAIVKYCSGKDFSNELSFLNSYDVIVDVLPKVKENIKECTIIQNKLSSKQKIDRVVDDIFEKNMRFSKEQIYDAVAKIDSNQTHFNNFVFFGEFIVDLMKLGEIVSDMKDPLVAFKKIQKENQNIKSMLEKIKKEKGVDFMPIYEAHITPEFKNLLSVKELKSEKVEKDIEEIRNTKKENNNLYEIANKKYTDISNEIALLESLGIELKEIKLLLEIKTEYDGIFKMPFLKIDDGAIVEYAIDRLNELELAISQTKEKVYEWLVYHGQDIKDILREKHSYQIREYVEKLKGMSEKFDRQLSETSSRDIKAMLDLYRKIEAMYAVVDEMKQNSFVVDISRFSK